MDNKEIALSFQLLGKIMELHNENPFKIRSYQNAYMNLRKLETPLSEMTYNEISAIKGVGKAITDKILELIDSGEMQTLEKYRSKTPEGLAEMLSIKGFGPKKIGVIWKELGIESVGELLYAVNENRLIELKGFGEKSQDDLKRKLEYYIKSRDKFHYAALEQEAKSLLNKLKKILPNARIGLCGEFRRRNTIIENIELLIAYDGDLSIVYKHGILTKSGVKGKVISARTSKDFPVTIYTCRPGEFGSKLFRYTGPEDFVKAVAFDNPGKDFRGIKEEKEVFDKAGLKYIEAELRDLPNILSISRERELPQLIEEKDIKGVLHCHTTYSDGLHSLADMVEYAAQLGYAYIGITDHSKSAFYASGLKEERLLEQIEEIDQLKSENATIQIFKGIESDILSDGSLDYDVEMLNKLDFVIASIHSNLNMDETKATSRLIKAIENPFTAILGHPTGRLLLSREGYPIDHKKVIDACAANQVAIEINANPYRLDLDWRWIPYAIEKGIMISVNPDAHSKEGIQHIRYGVLAARKGGLSALGCLNALSSDAFEKFILTKKP